MEERDFVAAIVANRESSAPRLVFADWLSERGDPRGEFIHVQCQLESLDPRDEGRIELEYRQRALLAEYRLKWSEEFRKSTSTQSVQYRRGMIDEIVIRAADFLDHSAKIMEDQPIRAARFNNLQNLLPLILTCPNVEHLRALNLYGCDLGDASVKSLIKSRHLASLTSLNLGQNRLSAAGLQALVKSTNLSRLESLNLDRSEWQYEAFARLSTSELGRNLCHLSLAGCDLTDHELRALSFADVLPKLRSLTLDDNPQVSGEAMEEFLGSPRFRTLRHVSLAGCWSGVRECRMLSKLSEPMELRSLILDTARLGSGSNAMRLSASRCLSGLVFLSLGRTRLDDMALDEILRGVPMRCLRTLELPNNQLLDESAVRLAHRPDSATLTRLNLSGNRIGAKGIAAIAESPFLRNLNELDLRHMDLGKREIQALVESDTLNRLTKLQITSRGDTKTKRRMKDQLIDRFGRAVCGFG